VSSEVRSVPAMSRSPFDAVRTGRARARSLALRNRDRAGDDRAAVAHDRADPIAHVLRGRDLVFIEKPVAIEIEPGVDRDAALVAVHPPRARIRHAPACSDRRGRTSWATGRRAPTGRARGFGKSWGLLHERGRVTSEHAWRAVNAGSLRGTRGRVRRRRDDRRDGSRSRSG